MGTLSKSLSKLAEADSICFIKLWNPQSNIVTFWNLLTVFLVKVFDIWLKYCSTLPSCWGSCLGHMLGKYPSAEYHARTFLSHNFIFVVVWAQLCMCCGVCGVQGTAFKSWSCSCTLSSGARTQVLRLLEKCFYLWLPIARLLKFLFCSRLPWTLCYSCPSLFTRMGLETWL